MLPFGAIAFAAALLGALALAAAWRTRRSLPGWANLSSLALRLLALGCAVLLAVRPENVRLETTERRPPLLLVVDDSQSLRLADTAKGPTRAAQARSFLAGFVAGVAERGWDLTAFDAGVQLTPRHFKDDHARAVAPESPLGERLTEAFERASSDSRLPPPAAVVLVSDGVVNRGPPLAQAAATLNRRGVPLFAVVLGEAAPLPPDGEIADLVANRDAEGPAASEAPRAGERCAIEVRAFLHAQGPERTGPLADSILRLFVQAPPGGLDPAEVPGVEKAAEGAYVEAGSQRVRLRTAPAWTTVKARFIARTPGLYRLRVALEPVQGERNLANNVLHGAIEVLPPKRQILYVASKLGHDYRHLKALFGTWAGPEVEVLADFVKPAAGENAQEWPVESVLGRRMGEGAAAPGRAATLIWSDPDPTHLSVRTLARLRAGLDTGELGILWIVSEPPPELARRLKGTPLEDAFLFRDFAEPVGGETPPQAPPAGALSAARSHPATAFAFASGTSGPDPFQVFGPTWPAAPLKVPRADTQVLLAAGGHPLLAAGMVGQGRVALLSTSELWRWLTPSRHNYERRERLAAGMLQQLLEWIAGSGSNHEPAVRLFLARDRWELGETVNARVSVRAPVEGEPVKAEYALTLLPADGSPPLPPQWQLFASDTGLAGGGPGGTLGVRVLTGTTGTPQAAGEWLVRVRALRPAGQEIGADRAQLVALGSGLEERSVRPDFTGMESAAQAAGPGGRALRAELKELSNLFKDLEPLLKAETITKEDRRPAVPAGALLVLTLCALLVDIWLRRG